MQDDNSLPVVVATGDSIFAVHTHCIQDQEQAKKLISAVVALFEPLDVVAQTLVRQFVQSTLDGEFYDRAEKAIIKRRVQQAREYEVQRTEELQRRKAARISHLAHSAGESPPDIAHLVSLERNFEEVVTDVDHYVKRPVEDAEYFRAMQKELDLLKNIDFLRTQAAKRRNEAIQLLEYWQVGFGQTLRQKTKEVIDAPFSEINANLPQLEAPPLSSTNENEDGNGK